MHGVWLLVLLTFIFDKNNDSVGKDVSIRAGKSDEKRFVVFFREFVLEYWYVYTSAAVAINTENNWLMCESVVGTCWGKETRLWTWYANQSWQAGILMIND